MDFHSFNICVYFLMDGTIHHFYYTNRQYVSICLLYKGLRSVGGD
jgi:hypothetical protein